QLTERGAVRIDKRCQAAEGLWAVGDVTGQMMTTHVAKYQARVAVDNILGKERSAGYAAIPRVIFADPEIAAAGLTEAQAREQGIDVATSHIDLAQHISRPWTYERDPRGQMGLVADRAKGTLVGAWAVAPMASEWIHFAALAIQAEVPLRAL